MDLEVAMRLHHRFEWDSKKASANREKHGISFNDAMKVLSHAEGDLYHVEVFDIDHSEFEDRWLTTSMHPEDPGIVMYICWTAVEDRTTRIINARYATKKEAKVYVEEIRDRQDYP